MIGMKYLFFEQRAAVGGEENEVTLAFQDTVPPQVTCPADRSVDVHVNQATAVSFDAPALGSHWKWSSSHALWKCGLSRSRKRLLLARSGRWTESRKGAVVGTGWTTQPNPI